MASAVVRLPVDGTFSLAAAASFGFGPNTGAPLPDDGVMRLAFVADDLHSHVGAAVRQQDDGSLVVKLEIRGEAGPDLAAAQISRVLSVDAPVRGWIAAGEADPVLGRVQAEYPGVRPVLFHSPYEAAAWSVLSQRRRRTQAIALRRRLSEAAGATFTLVGQSQAAFPLPAELLRVSGFAGIEGERMARLRAVARAALDGRLDAARLRGLPGETAMAELQQIRGLGPFYAMLVYLRSTGVTDGLALGEPRLAAYLRHYYNLEEIPDAETLERMAEAWRPFRTWAGVLFRAAGEWEGLPLDAQPLDGRPLDGRPLDGRPLDGRPFGAQPVDAQPFEAQPASLRGAGARAAGMNRTGMNEAGKARGAARVASSL